MRNAIVDGFLCTIVVYPVYFASFRVVALYVFGNPSKRKK